MKDLTYTLLKSFAAGFAALLLLSIALFWGRFYCDGYLYGRMAQEYDWASVTISPSGILPAEIEKDPNVARASVFNGHIQLDSVVTATRSGIFDYYEQRMPEGRYMGFYEYENKGDTVFYFDKDSGLIVHQFVQFIKTDDNKTERKKIKLYAGPEGISEKPTKELGRFYSPVRMQKEFMIFYSPEKMRNEYGTAAPITYDKKIRRFFKIDFDKKEVTKGPEIDKGINFSPIQIGQVRKGGNLLNFWWNEPRTEIKTEDKEAEKVYGKRYEPIEIRFYPSGGQYVPVLDESGLIFLVDRETLEIAGEAGYLPAPLGFFGSGNLDRPNVARPKNLLAFEIEPVAIKPDGEYVGMGVAALSRDGASMTAAVFDKEGKLIEKANTGVDGHYSYRDYDRDGIFESRRYITEMDMSKAVFWGQPGSPLATVLRYILENLQGPALNIAAFFTADSFEASSGHRALFFVTNSFIGMKGRQAGASFAWKFFGGILLISPSIMLSVLLAWSVKKDALTRGLCKKEKLCWMAGVFCFGLAGYISYRLCRKQAGLVTCQNCGMSRRVDMDVCHRCGSSWLIPELEDPGWRVRDS